MRDSNPLYDLLGGYYPGDPIPRLRHYGNLPSPVDLDSDALINNYLYELERELSKFGYSAAKKKLKRDVERALRARTSPRATTYDPMRAMELGDEEDVAGIAVGININPKDWIEDPGEMVKKTGKQWYKDLVNWNDYSSYVERNTLWDPLLRGKEVSPLVEFAYGEHLEGETLPGPKPFQLAKLGITTTKEEKFYDHKGNATTLTKEDDLFEKCHVSFQDFSISAKSSGARDKALRNYTTQVAVASSAELTNLLANGKITDPKQVEEIKSHLHRARLIRATNAINSKGDKHKYIFAQSGEFAEFGHGIGSGILQLNTDLSNYSMGGKTKEDVSKTIKNVLDTSNEDSSLSKLIKIRDETRAHFDSLGPSAKAEFDKNFKPVNDMIRDLEKLHKSAQGSLSPFQTGNLKGLIGEFQEKYASAGAVKGGHNNMSRRFLENDFLKGPMRDIVFDPRNSAIVGTRRLMNVSEETLRFYKREDFYDLINKLESDGLLGVAADITWNRIRARLNGSTPAAKITEFLEKRHYFGLIYKDDYAQGSGMEPKFFHLNKWVEKSKLFDNNFTVEQILVKGVGDAKDVTKKLKLKGDRSLNFGLDEWSRTGLTGTQKLTHEDLIDLINFKERDRAKLIKSGKSLKFGYSKYTPSENSAQLRKWLKEYNDQLGLKFDKKTGLLINNKENQKKLDSLFAALKKREEKPTLISATQAKAGIMQKYSAKLNTLRKNAFKKFYNSTLGKFVSAPAYLREVIAKAATKAINKVAAKVLGSAIVSATGGIGALIYPLIEKAVQYAVKKVQDTVGKVLTAIRHADIDIIEEFVEEGAQSLLKLVGCCAIVFALPTAALFYTITGALSSITPVDPTRTSDYGPPDSISGGISSGPPIDCPPGECIVVSTEGCFEFVGNWSSGGASQALPILRAAARNLEDVGGNYVDRLCAEGDISIVWDPGYADCGRIRGHDEIHFGNLGCWSYVSANQGRFNHLFAHETGHLYNRRPPGYGNFAAAVTADCGNQLSTYRGTDVYECTWNHNNPDEDFAETVGNYISILADCPTLPEHANYSIPDNWNDFWNTPGSHNNNCPNAYRGHLEFAESSHLFGP